MPLDLWTPLRILWQLKAAERSCRWSRIKLEQHQARRLAALRRFAIQRSPFYRKFHSGMENRPLTDLPILNKATMMENFDELVTDRSVKLADAQAYLDANGPGLFRKRYLVLCTSGSSGRRGVFLFSKAEWIAALAAIARPRLWAGLSGGLRKPGRSAMIASTTSSHYSAQVTERFSRWMPVLRLDAAAPLESLVEQLNGWQPEGLFGYPSVLRQLAEEQIAGRLRIQPRGLGCSAEVLTDETRRRAQEAWGLRVFDTYGTTEYAPIATECTHGGKHLFEDGAMIEVVDERGKAVPPGATGDRVLLTIFSRHTQPLIRYELTDMVRPLAGECPCGRNFRLIDFVEGRLEEVLYFPRRDGRPEPMAAQPLLFYSVMEILPVAGWQIIHEEQGLSVLLAGVRDASICDSVRSSIERVLEAEGALAPPIRVRVVEALERGATGKAPLIMSRMRKKACDAIGG